MEVGSQRTEVRNVGAGFIPPAYLLRIFIILIIFLITNSISGQTVINDSVYYWFMSGQRPDGLLLKDERKPVYNLSQILPVWIFLNRGQEQAARNLLRYFYRRWVADGKPASWGIGEYFFLAQPNQLSASRRLEQSAWLLLALDHYLTKYRDKHLNILATALANFIKERVMPDFFYGEWINEQEINTSLGLNLLIYTALRNYYIRTGDLPSIELAGNLRHFIDKIFLPAGSSFPRITLFEKETESQRVQSLAWLILTGEEYARIFLTAKTKISLPTANREAAIWALALNEFAGITGRPEPEIESTRWQAVLSRRLKPDSLLPGGIYLPGVSSEQDADPAGISGIATAYFLFASEGINPFLSALNPHKENELISAFPARFNYTYRGDSFEGEPSAIYLSFPPSRMQSKQGNFRLAPAKESYQGKGALSVELLPAPGKKEYQLRIFREFFFPQDFLRASNLNLWAKALSRVGAGELSLAECQMQLLLVDGDGQEWISPGQIITPKWSKISFSWKNLPKEESGKKKKSKNFDYSQVKSFGFLFSTDADVSWEVLLDEIKVE